MASDDDEDLAHAAEAVEAVATMNPDGQSENSEGVTAGPEAANPDGSADADNDVNVQPEEDSAMGDEPEGKEDEGDDQQENLVEPDAVSEENDAANQGKY